MENSEEENQLPLTPEIKLELLKKINELFKINNSSTFGITSSGQMDSTSTAELIKSLKK